MKIEEFREHAKSHNVIPVYRKLLADGETPLNIYKKLAQNKPGTFLLESAEHGGVWSRYSIVGASSRAVLTEVDGEAADRVVELHTGCGGHAEIVPRAHELSHGNVVRMHWPPLTASRTA